MLGLACCGGWAADQIDLSKIPGSAQMPLTVVVSPLPPKPADGRNVQPIHFGVWINADGSVKKCDVLEDSPKWQETARTALNGWKFAPVIWEGKAIPARTEVSFFLTGGKVGFSQSPVPNLPPEIHTENEFGLKMPVVKYDPDLQIPMLERVTRKRLEAGFVYLVGRDGLPYDFELLGASSESAYRAIINELGNQTFTPGLVGDEPVIVKMKQVISTMSMDKPPAELAGLVEAMDPVYPYEQLIAGTAGTAKVHFTLDAHGNVSHAEVVEASHPDFGSSLKAAIESWSFSPEAATELAERTYEHEFSPSNLPGGLTRLLAILRQGGTISSSRAQLSGSPQRVYSPGLSFPPDLLGKNQSGTAKIEFIVDRSGLAQLPHMLEATDPAFGWAAA
ncbi:MAG TPA: TonB family protein, partial [Opitutaceae bacterium]|nr:TonB family protein [Opitutaceae bacterium]